ncbi:MAG TPA: acyl-CoA dehydrogenase family protein [Pseudonocardia sp.]|jgi:alkylation response protein AidB-like acyl-CoA dehydrogenase|nr:acyl-CoA dehydrogenase family protein [Pseudonocardia sp.]
MTEILDRPDVTRTGAGTAPDADIIARATALVPLIREHAEQSSADRRVVPEVVTALKEAGLFGLLVPRRLGGLEGNLRTMMECVAEIARGDGSTAWAVALLNVCTWFSTTFSDQAQEEMFSTPGAKACGIFSPPLSSVRVDGGFRVSGRWAYSSGSFAADWAVLGIGMDGGVDANGRDDPRGLALIPNTDWTIEPTWFVTGMKGSGSDTIVVDDVFVPEHRTQRFADMVEGRFRTSHKGDEQNANMAFIPVAAVVLVAAQLGLGRHALAHTLATLPARNVAYTCYRNARNSPTHQVGVAEASTRFDQAELLMRRAAADVDGAAAAGIQLAKPLRARVRMDTGIIAELVKDGMDKLMTANGASSFADANVLSRIWRDAEIAGRHALVMPEVGKEAYGRMLLGADEPLSIDV